MAVCIEIILASAPKLYLPLYLHLIAIISKSRLLIGLSWYYLVYELMIYSLVGTALMIYSLLGDLSEACNSYFASSIYEHVIEQADPPLVQSEDLDLDKETPESIAKARRENILLSIAIILIIAAMLIVEDC